MVEVKFLTREGSPMVGKWWGSMRTARATCRWAQLGLEMAGGGLPAGAVSGSVGVARRRPSGESGAVWGGQGASGGALGNQSRGLTRVEVQWKVRLDGEVEQRH
jgi:hypothetical protein